jgi:hypothetical protein
MFVTSDCVTGGKDSKNIFREIGEEETVNRFVELHSS